MAPPISVFCGTSLRDIEPYFCSSADQGAHGKQHIPIIDRLDG
ncbi:hypothetical protein [Pseudorhizobium halotolerans]|nr:hypothetical protein [Pseudorhizobium halotolerans]